MVHDAFLKTGISMDEALFPGSFPCRLAECGLTRHANVTQFYQVLDLSGAQCSILTVNCSGAWVYSETLGPNFKLWEASSLL